jgi:hypothetical protein
MFVAVLRLTGTLCTCWYEVIKLFTKLICSMAHCLQWTVASLSKQSTQSSESPLKKRLQNNNVSFPTRGVVCYLIISCKFVVEYSQVLLIFTALLTNIFTNRLYKEPSYLLYATFAKGNHRHNHLYLEFSQAYTSSELVFHLHIRSHSF